MTIQGAIYELNNMLSSNDIPCYWKPAIKKIIETVEQNVGEISEQTDGDLISRNNAIKLVNYALAENKDVLEVLENMPSAEKTTLSAEKTTITDGDLISRTNLLKDIADLKKSPWFNDGKDIKDLFRHNSYVTRKEAVEIIEDLCIKKLPSAEKTAESEEE